MDAKRDDRPAGVGPMRRRGPVRLVSAGLFLLLAAGSVAMAASSRRVVDDQEQRLLEQRANEVGALFTLSGARLQEALGTASTVVGLTGGDHTPFSTTAKAAVASRLFGAMAVVQADGSGFRVVAAEGPDLGPGRTLGEPVAATLRRARGDGAFVSTPVLRPPSIFSIDLRSMRGVDRLNRSGYLASSGLSGTLNAVLRCGIPCCARQLSKP